MLCDGCRREIASHLSIEHFAVLEALSDKGATNAQFGLSMATLLAECSMHMSISKMRELIVGLSVAGMVQVGRQSVSITPDGERALKWFKEEASRR